MSSRKHGIYAIFAPKAPPFDLKMMYGRPHNRDGDSGTVVHFDLRPLLLVPRAI
ncbi:hypothetical protein FIBSPDRAFT_969802 [Athelia psychrophila]|uniref:Uncharacterized protein n=1 Tax=Athelia psychrophila TaxID=1759441 RepID=A0A167T6F8_9AGAM|nr:hypothetical protein FIBSPDRAFT_969802 [Fibularhizoctonia sp. CBS 109695]